MKIYRRSAPFGTVKESGLLFLAFACELKRFTSQLESMYGHNNAGVIDQLLHYSKAVSGSYCFAPCEEDLAKVTEKIIEQLLKEENINEIKEISSGKSTKKDLPIILNNNISKQEPIDDSSDIIITFKDKIKKYISHRILCKNCPLFPNEKHILESNLKKDDELDVIIIGDFPESENILSKYKYIN